VDRVALAGPSGAGKTTLGRALMDEMRGGRVSLGAIAAEEAAARGWPLDREHLQRAGDILRRRDPAALAREAIAHAEMMGRLCGWPLAVVDGVRLPEEAAVLRDHGYLVVLLEPVAAPPPGTHHTERRWREIEADLVLPAATVAARMQAVLAQVEAQAAFAR
jgi:ABC-type dipeptide/oligopeptide/nickel transport system ATPase component